MNSRICMGCMNMIYEGQNCACGWQNDYSEEESTALLAPGTLLNGGNYMVGRRLGRGGYGVTYIGRQQSELGLKVAIKEYYPKKLAGRNVRLSAELCPSYRPGMTQLDQELLRKRFLEGRKSFIEEAKRLAEFAELPAIVSVLGYFEENNTAYIVMEYINGIDLYHHMRNLGRTLRLQELDKYIYPLMTDLQKVHEKGIIHRDISPDNIMVTQGGSVKLIDFGAAVTAEEEEVKVQRKNGFAPLEQYDEKNMALGPWTDVYALCATIYYLLSGQVIPDARDRQFFDQYQKLNAQGVMVPARMDRILKRGLAVDYHSRYQSVKGLMKAVKTVRDRRNLKCVGAAAGIFAVSLSGMALGYRNFREEFVPADSLSSEMTGQDIPWKTGAAETEDMPLWRESAVNYAVFDGMVYIKYSFDDGTTMLARSVVGADDIGQVEYVTDGAFGEFCVNEGYLYLTLPEDGCLYRVNIADISRTDDAGQRLSVWRENGSLKKVAAYRPDAEYGFQVSGEYAYFVTRRESGAREFVRARLDGTEAQHTELGLAVTKCVFYREYIYMTVRENGSTNLMRMRLDGRYCEQIGSYDGEIADIRIDDGYIYYLLNARTEGESRLGRISTEGAMDTRLAEKMRDDLDFCYMTKIIDNSSIYYTCSVAGTEAVNNLYCFSLENGSNKQISSECGRYIVTLDTADFILFASVDGKEIRKMNKDGSNPRVMREADGSTGITDTVDATSLAIINDHVYYMDGTSVAYKKITD